jgi:hypothetical protein
MKKLFLFGFVLTSLLAWSVAGAYTGTEFDVRYDDPAPQVEKRANVDNPLADISIEDTYNFDKPKSDRQANKPDENVILQGGDTCDDPTVIESLPYNTTGTTEGYTDDYDEICPYDTPGSPDVVYEYTPPVDQLVDISLCGEGTYYDTKLYVYENTCPDAGNPFACNDDACDNSHTTYISELVGLEFVAGNTYYIVIDGYGGESGEYQLDMEGRSDLQLCPETPDPPIFSQSYLTGINGVNSDDDGGIQVFEDYRTSGTINSVHWWGIKYFHNGVEWVECFEDPQDFTISFWNDDGSGMPDISAPVYSETFTIEGDDTGDTFGAEGAPIYRYSATLGTPVDLDEGWVSILGSPGGDPECWFLWHSSTDQNEKSVGRDLDTNQLDERGYDLSICLNGTYVSLTGSCCDMLSGECFDDVEVSDCVMDKRFTVGVACADLDPPCGPQGGPGACCVDGVCDSPVEESDCDALGGFFYGGQDCAEFSCPEDVVYHKDFDGDTGLGDWTGDWGRTSTEYNSPPSCMTDSPLGNYGDDVTLTTELQSDVSLTGYFGYTLEFMTKFQIETGFDYCYLDVSTDGGLNWVNIYVFNGENPLFYEWHLFTADLGGFAEQNVRLRLQLITDGAYNVDGQYIDDIFIYGEATDTSPPLILHTGPTTYTSVPNEYTAVATITDLSGISEATINYMVDGGPETSLGPDEVVGDEYTFIIPQQEAGAHVEYYISATDNNNNTGVTATHHYVSGTVVYYDDDDPEFIYQFAEGNRVATRFTPTEPAMLVTGMLRLYTDSNRPLDYVDVEIWSDDGAGLPDASIYGPMEVYPQSDLEHPQAWTYVDFRGPVGIDFAADEDFHLGYAYRSEWPVILGDSPAVTERSSQDIGAGWVAATTDFHIRAIVAYNYGACCDEANDECTMTYESDCAFTFSLGQTCEEVGCGGGACGDYVIGDYNCSGGANVADVVDMYSRLKTGAPVYPDCECDCLGDGNVWPVGGDVNSSCAMNVADVVDLYSKLKTGSPELTPCLDCPPDSWNPAPGGGDRPLVVPNLESKARLKTGSGMD